MDTSPVLDAASLDGRSFENILKDIQEVFDDTTFPTVRRWREQGGKVVGHFQVYFPEEIAEAAGLLPFKVRGAPVEAVRAESRFGSYLCSILKTSLELALAGTVDLRLQREPAAAAEAVRRQARNAVAAGDRRGLHPDRPRRAHPAPGAQQPVAGPAADHRSPPGAPAGQDPRRPRGRLLRAAAARSAARHRPDLLRRR